MNQQNNEEHVTPCRECNGRKVVPMGIRSTSGTETCPTCKGTGVVQSVACTCPANGASSACALHGDEQHRIVRIDENPESPSVKPGGGRELTHLPRGWHFRYGQRNGELFFALHGPAGELAVFPMLVAGVRADVVRLFFKGNT